MYSSKMRYLVEYKKIYKLYKYYSNNLYIYWEKNLFSLGIILFKIL